MSRRADRRRHPTASGGGRAGDAPQDFDARLNQRGPPARPGGSAGGAPVRRRAALHGDRPAHRRGAVSAEPRRARLLANFGVGFNHIDIDAAKARGLAVSNTPDVLTDATADIAITLLLMVTPPRRGRGAAPAGRRVDRLASDPHAGHPGERQDARPRGHGPDRARGRQAGAPRLRHAGHLPRSLPADAG